MKCGFCGSPCHPEQGDEEVPVPNNKKMMWVHKMCHTQFLADRWSDEVDRRIDNTAATG